MTTDDADAQIGDVSAAPEARSAGPWLARTVYGGIGAIALVACIAIAVLALQIRDQHQAVDRRDAAVTVARTQALDLLGLSGSNVNQRIDALLSHSTGAFHNQLANIRSAFRQMVQQNKISSSGNVDLAAVQSSSSTSETVLLALSSNVSNSQSRTPEQRAYRLSIQLVRHGSQWLVAKMEFSS